MKWFIPVVLLPFIHVLLVLAFFCGVVLVICAIYCMFCAIFESVN